MSDQEKNLSEEATNFTAPSENENSKEPERRAMLEDVVRAEEEYEYINTMRRSLEFKIVYLQRQLEKLSVPVAEKRQKMDDLNKKYKETFGAEVTYKDHETITGEGFSERHSRLEQQAKDAVNNIRIS